MMRRTRVSLVYSAGGEHSARVAPGRGEADMARQCVWQSQQILRGRVVQERLQVFVPEYPDYALRRFWK